MPQGKTGPTQERIKEHEGNKGKRHGQFQNTQRGRNGKHKGNRNGVVHQNAPQRPARPTRPERESTSRRPDERVRTQQRTQPFAAKEQPPSVWTRMRPEGTQPLPATEQPPFGWTCAPQRVPSPYQL